MKSPHHLDIVRQFPTLETLGLAVQHFPRYVNQSSDDRHTHNHVEMTLVLSSTVRSLVAEQEFVQNPGSLSIVHYGQTHRILTGPEGAELFNVYLDEQKFVLPSLPPEVAPSLYPWFPIHPAFVHERNRFLVLDCGNPEKLHALLKLVLQEQQEQQTGFQQAMQTAFSLFLLEGARHFGAQVPDFSDPLEGLRIQLDRRPEAPVRLDDLCRELGVSKSHLCRRFKAHTGKTLVGYVHAKRIEKALHLLVTTDRKVSDIAQTCGFEDLGQFNLKFKQITGKRPRDSRRSTFV